MNFFLQGNCIEDQFCLPATPEPSKLDRFKGNSYIVLVRPSNKVSSWLEVDPSLAAKTLLPTPTMAASTFVASSPVTITTTYISTTTTAVSVNQESVCEVGLDLQDCKANEACVQVIILPKIQ